MSEEHKEQEARALEIGRVQGYKIARALGTSYSDVVHSFSVMKQAGETIYCLRSYRPPNSQRDHNTHNPSSLAFETGNIEDLEFVIERVTREALIARGYAAWLNTLPSELARAERERAQHVLSVDYTVYLGSHTEDTETFARGLLETEYRKEVEACGTLIMDMLQKGDIRSPDQCYESIHEEASVAGPVDAYRILLCSQHDDAWEEDSSDQPDPEDCAACAKQKDIEEWLSRAGVNASAVEEKDCAACGSVVVWAKKTEECPHCDLSFDTEEGLMVRDADDRVLCEDCAESLQEPPTLLPAGAYTCAECDTEYYNPKKDSA